MFDSFITGSKQPTCARKNMSY